MPFILHKLVLETDYITTKKRNFFFIRNKYMPIMQLGIEPDSKNLHARWSDASHTLQFFSNHVYGM